MCLSNRDADAMDTLVSTIVGQVCIVIVLMIMIIFINAVTFHSSRLIHITRDDEYDRPKILIFYPFIPIRLPSVLYDYKVLHSAF